MAEGIGFNNEGSGLRV